MSDTLDALTPLQRAVLALRETRAELEQFKEPIAVIGIGCRFPGGASGPESYWNLLKNGVDAVTEVPADRWDADALYSADANAEGKLYARHGGFLENVSGFDADFFGISPREAVRMDPQQRLLLEVSWEALEHAGQNAETLAGSQTGIFVGISTNDYGSLSQQALSDIDPYSGTGNAFSVATGRLSYFLNLHGPNLAVDTACSSSLVAVHLACQSLRANECGVALAGGVNLILTPDTTAYLCRLGALAPGGRCKTFDASADGYVRGEGCGIVVLKRLSDARRDGDSILAVIRGSAVNHDGRSNGLTAPNGAAQEAVIRAALENGGVLPSEVGYVEAHGTGTPLGDPVELQALGAVTSPGRSADQRLIVGSVKTNFGHLESAAGVAGLIKTVLAIQHGEIPAHLHFEAPNPHLAWDECRLTVPRNNMSWPAGAAARVAGVSSFGISGTNAHVVLAGHAGPDPAAAAPGGPYLLAISARRPQALRDLASATGRLLGTVPLYDLCYSFAVRRPQHEYRLAVAGRTAADFEEQLAAFAGQTELPETAAGQRRKVAFVFAGQGGQWLGMGRELLASEPVFREAIAACDRAMRPYVAWPLVDVLQQPEELRGIDLIQPALFAMQMGLTALWRSWGIEPDAVVGHSMGEVAAACVAGALSLDDAAAIICRRSLLLRGISGRGAMAIVELSMAQTQARLTGLEDKVSIAVNNSSRSTVISGDEGAIAALLEGLEQDGIFCRRVKVDVASHSPQVDELRGELLQSLSHLAPQAAAIPFYSTVTGRQATGRQFQAQYWVDNLRQPVRFADAVQLLIADGHDVFVEIGPHPVLLPAVEDNLRQAGRTGVGVASTRRQEPERESMLASLAKLFMQGQPVAWRNVYPQAGRPVALPAYPWQRERFWMTARTRQTTIRGAQPGHALLGVHVQPADQSGYHIWESDLSLSELPYLGDHRLGEMVVFPAAGYAELALSAARDVFGTRSFTLESLAFQKLLVIPNDSPVTVQLTASQDLAESATMQIATRPAGQEGGGEWTTVAAGTLRGAAGTEIELHSTAEALRQCTEFLDGTDYYKGLASQGLPYGPAFAGIGKLWRRPGEVVATLRAPDAADGRYLVHPATLDMCFQAFGAALPGWAGVAAVPVAGDSPYLPVGLDTLRWYEQPRGELTVHARLIPGPPDDPKSIKGDLWLCHEDGRVALEVRGFKVQQLGAGATATVAVADAFYQVEWQTQPLPSGDRGAGQAGGWLILEDGGDLAGMIAARLDARGAASIIASTAKEYRQTGPRRFEWNPGEPADFARLLEGAFGPGPDGCRGVVCMLQNGDAVASVVSLIQALDGAGWPNAPKLAIVTAGVHLEAEKIGQAPLWGLGRTIAIEQPEFRCACIDLSASPTPPEIDSLCDEIWWETAENQVLIRNRERRVARLVRLPLPASSAAEATPANGQDFRLEIETPGILDQLSLRAFRSRRPGPDEVEISVQAAGLNFLDVLAAMGIRPDLPPGAIQLGGECAGIVHAVGDQVEGVRPGDAVIAIAPSSFATKVTTPAVYVVPKPANLTFEEAATVPIAFVTAYYAFVSVGRLQPGETVLIHSASGGVGLAAIQIARWLGAEVIATAGSEEKRQFLRNLGVAHVFNSRDLSFADDVMACTGGRGVDAVLNSLTGDAVARSLDVLAPYGRFLEIGKKDVYRNHRLGLFPFHKNLTYSLIDLARMLLEKPALCCSLLREVTSHLEAGRFLPLQHRSHRISEASTAFHEMAQGRHIGKLIVSLTDVGTVPLTPLPKPAARGEATYLITGGLGGLGLSAADWLVEQGARNLVLMGRGEPSAAATAIIDRLRRLGGARVEVMRGDVSQREDVARVLASIDTAMPPLAGLIHAAGVLEDSTILQLDRQSLRRTMAPKVDGARHLHELTQAGKLDFFVLYSSGSGLLGTPGQANYAAANAYLDALAHHRAQRGLPAMSVNWGPFSEVGMVAGQVARLAKGGMGSLTPAQGTEALELLLPRGITQVAVLPFQWEAWRQQTPLLSQLLSAKEKTASRADETLLRALAAADEKQRKALLEQHLRQQLATVLRLPLHRIAPGTPFNTLGLDSLMALELRNRLEGNLGLRLPATLVWKHPTAEALAAYLTEALQLPSAHEQQEPPAEPAPEPPAAALDRISELSDEEVERLFAEKLMKGAG